MTKLDVFQEKEEIANKLYALIYPVLAKRDPRAHVRAQLIAEHAIEQMLKWILKQKVEKL